MNERQKHNLGPLAELDLQAEKQQYGTLTVTLEMFQGKIVGLQGNQMQRVKFKDGENAQATQLILSEIKALFENKESGMFTLSIKMAEGNLREVYLQRNLKKNYQLPSADSSSEG